MVLRAAYRECRGTASLLLARPCKAVADATALRCSQDRVTFGRASPLCATCCEQRRFEVVRCEQLAISHHRTVDPAVARATNPGGHHRRAGCAAGFGNRSYAALSYGPGAGRGHVPARNQEMLAETECSVLPCYCRGSYNSVERLGNIRG